MRINEATEDDLNSKLEKSMEETVFLHQEYEDLKKLSLENEKRLKAELTELQSELAGKFNIESSSDEISTDRQRNVEDDFQTKGDHHSKEIQSLNSKILDLEQRGLDLFFLFLFLKQFKSLVMFFFFNY